MTNSLAGRCFIILSIFCAALLFSYGVTAVLPAQATAPAPPIISDDDLWLSAAEIDEGDTVVLSGVFTSSGAIFSHTVAIDWGDNLSDTLLLPPGLDSFTTTHVYANNPPPPQISYAISVTVANELGDSTAVITLTVHNLPPSLQLGATAVLQPGQIFSRTATFTDPGDDEWMGSVDYGVGDGFQPLPLNPDKSFQLSQLYETTGTYTVTVIITDNDGGVGQATLTVIVTDLPPTYLPIVIRQEPPPPPPPPPPDPDWLIYLNQFRASVGLHLLTENEDWSGGGWLHSRYMVKNDVVTHSQDPNNPWYSLAGHLAGQNGNTYVSGFMNASDNAAINFWMTAPFHALPMLHPRLYAGPGLGVGLRDGWPRAPRQPRLHPHSRLGRAARRGPRRTTRGDGLGGSRGGRVPRPTPCV